jgi:hypothetical protein
MPVRGVSDSGFIHVLLVVAIVIVVINLVQDQRGV